ncbi:MAG: hypothetical protein ACRDD7_04830 [Peptostreptococcaceae bacterium]
MYKIIKAMEHKENKNYMLVVENEKGEKFLTTGVAKWELTEEKLNKCIDIPMQEEKTIKVIEKFKQYFNQDIESLEGYYYNHLLNRMESMSIEKLGNVAGHILLRPNDNKKFMGDTRFKAYIKAFEKILENHIGEDIYNYYYHLNDTPHGFCTFERWKLGLLN